MTIEKMRKLVQSHIDFETELNVEGVLSTLIEEPIYEFYPDRLKFEGKAKTRQFYQDHFNFFFPLIKSHKLINECWESNSVCMEYDLFLTPPYDKDRIFRIMVVLTAKNDLLIGERFYVEHELVKLMTGPFFKNLIKF